MVETSVYNEKFSIRVNEDFEGPIELLLRLVEQRKLAINEISLAQVTDEYIQYLHTLEDQDFTHITHFIGVAATLILIKSKSLLPVLDLTDEEEESIEELQYRLRLYRLFQDKVPTLQSLFWKEPLYTRPFRLKAVPVFSPDKKNMTLPLLAQSLQEVIGRIPTEEKLQQVQVRMVVHIEELINDLIDRVQTVSEPISFKEFSRVPLHDPTIKEVKVHTIVSFLAMLELARNGMIHLAQHATFDDIAISQIDEK